jgi:ComF family protein
MLGEWARGLVELILPPLLKCQLCFRRRAIKNTSLCFACTKELDYWSGAYHQCEVCGRFIASKGLCSRCVREKPPFIKARAVGPYRGILKECLYNLKFRGDRRLAVPLGRMLGKKMKASYETKEVDIIVPVPMYPERLKMRGFNQAALIARETSREILKPVNENLLIKKRDTLPQVQLSQLDRMTNLTGSFAVKNNNFLRGKTVLLVDDIYTTGSTVKECTLELMDSGAERVVVGTIATGINFSSTE